MQRPALKKEIAAKDAPLLRSHVLKYSGKPPIATKSKCGVEVRCQEPMRTCLAHGRLWGSRVLSTFSVVRTGARKPDLGSGRSCHGESAEILGTAQSSLFPKRPPPDKKQKKTQDLRETFAEPSRSMLYDNKLV